MNVLITHVYSADNKGDAALLGVLIDEVRETFRDATINVLSMDTHDGLINFRDVPVAHSYMYYVKAHKSHKIIELFYGLFMMTYTLMAAKLTAIPLPKKWSVISDSYKQADIVIAVGGGYLRTKPGITSMFDFILLLHPFYIAKAYGKQSFLYTQSVGPLHRRIERLALSRTIRRCIDLALIREDKSMQLLHEIGVRNCRRTVDAGFLLKTENVGESRIHVTAPNDKLVVGVTARAWLDMESQMAYETALAETLDYVVKHHNAYIVFIPQVTAAQMGDDDRVVNRSIYGQMSEQQWAQVIEDEYDYTEIKALYDQLDVILGTRFHSVIFSLTSNVPALAIEYEYKTSGIMHDLQLDEWTIKIEDVTAKRLISKIDVLIEQSDDYREHLKKVLPAYVSRAHEAIEMIANNIKD